MVGPWEGGLAPPGVAVARCLWTGRVTPVLWVDTLAVMEGHKDGGVSPPAGCHHWMPQAALGGVSGPFPSSSLPGGIPSWVGPHPTKTTGAGRRWLGAL